MSQVNTNDGRTPETVVLYDADAIQRIPLRVETDEGYGEVVHLVGPLDDEPIKAFDIRREVKLGQAEQKNAVETKSLTLDAATELYDELTATPPEGYGEEGEETPENWKEIIGADEKQFVIEDVLLAAEVITNAATKKLKRIGWGAQRRPSSVQLRCYFSGEQLVTEHFPREPKPSAAAITEFNAIRSSVWLVQGTKLGKGDTQIPPKMARYAKLYDVVFDQGRARGYKGRVPMHHKSVVIQHYMGGALEVQEKNSNASGV